MVDTIDIINIEMPVLGCLLIDYKRFADYIPQLSADDFVYERDVFEIIKAEYDSGNKTDTTLILSKLCAANLGNDAAVCGERSHG